MVTPLNEDEVLQAIADGMSAEDLLEAADPAFERRLKRLCKGLSKLIEDVGEHYPDAQYYVSEASDINLMLGESHHGARGDAQPELVAASFEVGHGRMSGGGW